MLSVVIFIAFCYLAAVVGALFYNYLLKEEGFDGILWRDCFNPKKFFSVFVGLGLSLIPDHVIEQYVLRLYHPDCRQCIMGDACVVVDQNTGEFVNNCGCSPKARAMSPIESCAGRYDEIIWNKSEYESLRAEFPVSIVIKAKE